MSDLDEPITETSSQKQDAIKLCHELYLSHFVEFIQTDLPSLVSINTLDDTIDVSKTFLDSHFNSKNFFKEGILFETLSTRLFLRRNHHRTWLSKHFFSLPESMLSLDASQPWIVFWIIHSFLLLSSDNLEDAIYEDFTRFQSRVPRFFQPMLCASGGFGGGPGQFAHLATTYACLASLVESKSFDMLHSLNKQTFTCWLKSLRDPITGGFFVHEGGELDIRGTYCAVAIATILDLDKETLFEDIELYIQSLQSYDGGIAGYCDEESHAGYTYCGLAALALLQKAHYLDLNSLLFWVVQRQNSETGGFQGRCNKLHDSCYSFWCGATIQILSQLKIEIPSFYQPCIFNTKALQMYILGCCQEAYQENMLNYKGGLKDKPLATPDLYHTCYALSGLSISQAMSKEDKMNEPFLKNSINWLQETNPLLNITTQCWNQWVNQRTRKILLAQVED